MSLHHKPLALVTCAVVACLLGTPLLAVDPPDSEINPQSGHVEITDTTRQSDNSDVRHTVDPGGGLARSGFNVTSNGLDDLSPRLTISADGDTWIVWWRDDTIDKVLARKHTFSTKTWSDETLVSGVSESCRNPEIAHDGTNAWVVFECDDGDDTVITVNAIDDDPNPIVVRNTEHDGNLDSLIHLEAAVLWVTWVDSASDVGYSTYDDGTKSWSLPGYESYAADTVEDARERIRSALIGE